MVQQAQAAQAAPFRSGSKAVRLNLPTTILTQFGQLAQRVELQPVGYLHKLWIRITGTIVTGAGTPAANWLTYQELPWSLLSKIRVYVTPGVDLINISGASLNDFLRFSRDKYRSDGDWAAWGSAASGNAAGNVGDNFRTNVGAMAASTTYTFNACWEIPISTDDSLLWGLVPLQNDLAKCNVEVTLNNVLQIASAVPGVTFTPSFTVSVVQESFVTPQDAAVAPPFLGFAHKIIETLQSVTGTGDQYYRPLINPVYLRHFMQFENGATIGRMGAGVGNTALTNLAYRFAQQTYLYNEPYAAHVQRVKSYYGVTLPDGAIYIDAANGLGQAGIVDPRDFINTSQQTSVQIVPTVAGGTSLTNAQMRVIDEYLTPA